VSATLAFDRLAKREGMGHLRLHDLRHFAATTMLVRGVGVRTAAGRLGHAVTCRWMPELSSSARMNAPKQGGVSMAKPLLNTSEPSTESRNAA